MGEKSVVFIIYGDGCAGSFQDIQSNTLRMRRYRGHSMEDVVNNMTDNAIVHQMRKDVQNFKGAKLVFLFGQIDIFYTYYQTTMIEGKKHLYKKIIDKFCQLLSDLGVLNQDLLVVSCLPNNAGSKEFEHKIRARYNLPNNYKISLRDVNQRRLKFNRYLATCCSSYGITYIDCDQELLDKDGLIKAEYRNPNLFSLHILREKQLELLSVYLHKHGFPLYKNLKVRKSRYNQPNALPRSTRTRNVN